MMGLTWTVFIIQAFLASIFTPHIAFSGLPLLIVFVTSLFLLIDFSKLEFPKAFFVVLFLSYLFRLALLFFDLYGQDIMVLPHSGLDSEMFNQWALRGMETGGYDRGEIYSFTIGVIYTFFGRERMLSQFFNILISMQAILLIYKTLNLYEVTERIKFAVLTVVAFIPNYAILSSILLRESIIVFLLVLSFYCFSKWLLEGKNLFLIPAFGLGLLVAVFHSGSIFIVGAYVLTLVLFDQEKRQFRFSLKSILITLLILPIAWFIIQNYYELFFAKFARFESFEEVTDIYVMGESGYYTGLDIGHPILEFIVNTPLRMFYFIFSPLPWDWRGVVDVIAFVFSGLFYGGTLYLAIRTIWKNKNEQSRYILLLLVVIFVGLVFFAWGVSNAGTALRHRDKFIGLFIVLFALTIDQRQLKIAGEIEG